MKRAFDIVIAIAVLLATLPVWLSAMALIKIHDRGPVFYRASRIGRRGRPYLMLKFRTMVLHADRIGASSTADGDPRITPVGRWMRKWKVDELPQLVNVLRGEMSLVGPRPQIGWAVDRYTTDERRVLDARPGITDWASIVFANEGEILKGHANADDAYMTLIHPTKMRLALHYIDTASMTTDLRIIWATARAILGRRLTADQILET